MSKTNVEENIKEVLGNYVLQLVQAQTFINQLQEELAALRKECQATPTPQGPPSANG